MHHYLSQLGFPLGTIGSLPMTKASCDRPALPSLLINSCWSTDGDPEFVVDFESYRREYCLEDCDRDCGGPALGTYISPGEKIQQKCGDAHVPGAFPPSYPCKINMTPSHSESSPKGNDSKTVGRSKDWRVSFARADWLIMVCHSAIGVTLIGSARSRLTGNLFIAEGLVSQCKSSFISHAPPPSALLPWLHLYI